MNRRIWARVQAVGLECCRCPRSTQAMVSGPGALLGFLALDQAIHHHLGRRQCGRRVGIDWGSTGRVDVLAPLGSTPGSDRISAADPGFSVFAIEGPHSGSPISMSGRDLLEAESASSRNNFGQRSSDPTPASPRTAGRAQRQGLGRSIAEALQQGEEQPKATLEIDPAHRCP